MKQEHWLFSALIYVKKKIYISILALDPDEFIFFY